MPKSARLRVRNEIGAYIESLGADIHLATSEPTYRLSTLYGLAYLSVHAGEHLPWLHVRFEDVFCASIYVDCNRFSGKYNCHPLTTDPEAAIARMISHIGSIRFDKERGK